MVVYLLGDLLTFILLTLSRLMYTESLDLQAMH